MEEAFEILKKTDPEVAEAIRLEVEREHGQLEMIASENFVSRAVLNAMGSVMTNKYAEGYPGKRYYGGCDEVDKVEVLAQERAKALFGADHANVQPHSGSQANMTAYFAFLSYGEKIMGLSLAHGGHLTHGHPVNFSGMFFEVSQYTVSPETRTIDYDVLEDDVLKERPKLLVAGASAYPRKLDFKRLREICDKASCYLLVDMAHIAGLIAAGLHPDPVPYADVITSTTHKTLRGPRGGLILCPEEHREKVDKLNFPGTQGGPFMHVIAAKAVCFKEAMTEEFKAYQRQIVANAQALARRFMERGFDVVSGGTDTHLLLLDLSPRGLTGKKAERALEEAGITVNKNTVPFDKKSPFVTSGIRVGTPALTTRGMKEPEMEKIADLMCRVLENIDDEQVQQAVKKETAGLCEAFPLYAELRR
ncbi:MAG: aminotransferase class I/II-fold pyridoxal phosphate-dependent enzyme [Candidatus Latescibacteria bacterium]|nr:aminotransferase class I/II-fold pyridoxal phosphate-dependent enzyme [Candidatus Latescibacterota bacterium]NIO01013.1 aminotransferase class I/II-fold pyridoxal phosphate-dependent enzyme [Candidatus Latescibacterota bacterium]NIO27412.1 aminotransferase class I/II-fold pyridoxal phosphate-dependent enzyme [Candidatus Latescibacterota bacterium]NIO54934.1 aminotransferase class I/II-fold pyridoxal phosphate-dependent enzyme [Candidatus Latescibacterota bacterium]NIT01023.1 aminotransferase